MNKIICPHCHAEFEIDEASYNNIAKQVRDGEFEAELNKREQGVKKDAELQLALKERDFDAQLKNISYQKQAELDALTARLKQQADAQKLAVQEVEAAKDAQISRLEQMLKTQEESKKLAVKELEAQKDAKIAELESKLQLNDKDRELAVKSAVSDKDRELAQKDTKIVELEKNIEEEKGKSVDALGKAKADFERQLKDKEEQLAYYKDLKTRMSTKMVGETLEQHCETEFNRLRALGFQRAQFGKDNDASSGSKGDYIFREFTDDGVEIISIMFEMKNETDTTSTKHKNEDFFKELDKDRREKKCEYAVLVSMLEADSELYNSGIVDVSYRYEKMYVVRPQFFIPIITLLRNAALNAAQYKRELKQAREQNIDISHFEENVEKFKQLFGKHCEDANRQYDAAIEEIDKVIDHLSKVKEALRLTEKHLRSANSNAESLTIKSLTKGNPTMEEKFRALKDGGSEDED